MRRTRGYFTGGRTLARVRVAGAWIGLAALAGGFAQTAAAGAPSVMPSVRFHHGSVDLGDPLVPGYGNGGYRVSHYGITLSYGTTSRFLIGRTVVRARLIENLSRFNLDFALPASSVSVNGKPAAFKTIADPKFVYGKELVVTPPHGLRAGTAMTVVVSYRAFPFDVKVAHHSDWTTTTTGITVWGVPDAASEWWFPGNDYPSDKATYDITVTTSKAVQVITNGRLVSRRVHGPGATTRWSVTSPLSTHLTFLNIGRYDVVRQPILGATPAYFAYERTGSTYVQRARADVSKTPSILDRLQQWFGPYPFPVAGAIVSEPQYGTAFESQTRPTFTAPFWKRHPHNIFVVVHELAHQWFGDDVGMSRWRHIWLAEGFATYAEWLWSGAHGNGTAEQLFEANYQLYPKGDVFWTEPVASPFYPLPLVAYERGGMTLQALRNRVGSATFFDILQAWTRIHRFQSQPTLSFEALAERLSGQDLQSFFQVWLHSAHRPAPIPRNGFPRSFAGTRVTQPPSFNAIQRTDADLAGK